MLSGESFILNQHNSFFHSLEQNILAGLSFLPDILCEISDINASGNMVANGKRYCLSPALCQWTAPWLQALSLKPRVTFQIAIAYPKSNALTRPVRDLILLLLKQAENRQTA